MSQFYQGTTSGSLPPSVPTSFLLDDANSAVPLANVIQVSGGAGVETSLGASNQIVITLEADRFNWSDQAMSFSAQPQNGYFCTGALAVSLPATAGLVTGSTIIIYVDTGSVVSILANTGQFIQIADQISSSGGNLNSLSSQGSTVTLVFRVSDLTWHTISSLGNWGVI